MLLRYGVRTAVGHNAAMPAIGWAVPDPRELALRIRLRAVRINFD
jgi:hypothetical protein